MVTNKFRKRPRFDDSVNVKSLYRPKPMIDPFKPPEKPEEKLKPITDAEGLNKASAEGDTYKYGKTLYIAGSHTARDWYDDFTKIPFGTTSGAYRYQKADEALKANPDVTRVVGHSLGGAVALELQKNHPNLKSRTYGAPVWDPFGQDRAMKKNVERYANYADPVAIMDSSAHHSVRFDPTSLSGPHEFGTPAQNHFSDV